MHTQAFLSRIDVLIASRSILRHPFYVAWQQGTLNRKQLSTYATVYWPHVAAFPTYLENAVERTSDSVIRTGLERNLEDERSNPRPHPELWLDFAAGLGADRRTVTDAPVHPAAGRLVDTIARLTRSDTARGLAALYAYEAQQPEVSTQKLEGLREHYGVTESGPLAYFRLHAEMDLAHRRNEREALGRSLDAGAAPEAVQQAVGQTLKAYWGLLDGVCDAAGIQTQTPERPDRTIPAPRSPLFPHLPA